MPRLVRPARHARDRAAVLAGAASQRLVGPVCRRKKTLALAGTALAGTALALAGAGSASAATSPDGRVASAAQHARSTMDMPPEAVRQAPQLPTIISSPAGQPARPQAVPLTWKRLRDAINWQTSPAAARQGRLPFADRRRPVGTSGPQNWMPISGSQLANATTIVQQTLAKRMGIRSAVVAVATAMQESRLHDLGYGDADSLGLFQQRPSSGWGTAQQIMNPAFAANAFLAALQRYQAGNPSWAAQPLWASAQGVQKSGLPFAYAQWEAQAASLVTQIARSQQQ
ncbi:MAG: hypothetical protein WBH47_21780 [Streptosporangiaceae bacterium]